VKSNFANCAAGKRALRGKGTTARKQGKNKGTLNWAATEHTKALNVTKQSGERRKSMRKQKKCSRKKKGQV